MFNEKNNDQNVIAMIEDIRKGGDENLNDLTEEEKEDLERIQYETYIRLDKYVEALENSGKFSVNDSLHTIKKHKYHICYIAYIPIFKSFTFKTCAIVKHKLHIFNITYIPI